MKGMREIVISGKKLLIPTNFTPTGVITEVERLYETPAFVVKARKKRATGARAAGLKYEREVNLYLERELGEKYIQGPWYQYKSDSYPAWRYLQPDGLWVEPVTKTITIVEIKLRHTARSWWQLAQHYGPLIKFLYPKATVRYLEIYKFYNPSVRYPVEFASCRELRSRLDEEFRILKYLH